MRKLVIDDEISEDVAKAAVQAVGYEDPDRCLNWSLEHQFEDELIEELSDQFDKEMIGKS